MPAGLVNQGLRPSVDNMVARAYYALMRPEFKLFIVNFAAIFAIRGAGIRLAAVLFWLTLLQASAAVAQPARSQIFVTDLTGPIGPASANHVQMALQQAEDSNANLLVLRIDTPGGLDASMRDIISDILASSVPVASWVTPAGARAASAGTYIMTASHIAAMSPTTNIGSSTPVSIGAGGAGDMDNKVINDAAAYLQGLAELRNRNTDWARLTVTEADNLSASDALSMGVIDFIAADLEELLTAADGRQVAVADGQTTINTSNPAITVIDTDWRHTFLGIITNPNIAYILLIIGVYGLILEFYSPGIGVAGITGIICLLIGAYAVQMLPISYAGLALIVIGIGLMIFEIFTPSFGVFGLGGLVAFVLGSVMLFDTDQPAWRVSLALIAALAVSTGGLVFLVIGAAIRARVSPVTTGVEAMHNQLATATEDFETQGHVHLNGEIWQATSEQPVKKGDKLYVSQVNGLILTVTPHQHSDP
tara:strand:- start:121414 stop:122847 length:1434 start_codon:yes stop_codon:yes gene_type:complete